MAIPRGSCALLFAIEVPLCLEMLKKRKSELGVSDENGIKSGGEVFDECFPSPTEIATTKSSQNFRPLQPRRKRGLVIEVRCFSPLET